MKMFGLINIGVLPLILEALSPAYAQRDPREQDSRRPQQEQEAKPERHRQGKPDGREPKPLPQEAQPQRQPQQARPAPQEQPQRRLEPKPEKFPQQIRPSGWGQPETKGKQELRRQPQSDRTAPQASREHEGQHRSAWPGRRAQNWKSEHRTWQDRGGYKGYRIPDARYRSRFGPSHGFRMFSFPLLVIDGFPRFQFGGFWFSVIDPWPEYWSDDWYGNDDLYIDYYAGGYYLRNRRHPQDRIAITVHIN